MFVVFRVMSCAFPKAMQEQEQEADHQNDDAAPGDPLFDMKSVILHLKRPLFPPHPPFEDTLLHPMNLCERLPGKTLQEGEGRIDT